MKLKHLSKVDSIDFGDDEGPVVKLEFVSKVMGAKSIYYWRMVDAEDGAQFLAICRRHIDANKRKLLSNANMKCLRCDQVWKDFVVVVVFVFHHLLLS